MYFTVKRLPLPIPVSNTQMGIGDGSRTTRDFSSAELRNFLSYRFQFTYQVNFRSSRSSVSQTDSMQIRRTQVLFSKKIVKKISFVILLTLGRSERKIGYWCWMQPRKKSHENQWKMCQLQVARNRTENKIFVLPLFGRRMEMPEKCKSRLWRKPMQSCISVTARTQTSEHKRENSEEEKCGFIFPVGGINPMVCMLVFVFIFRLLFAESRWWRIRLLTHQMQIHLHSASGISLQVASEWMRWNQAQFQSVASVRILLLFNSLLYIDAVSVVEALSCEIH